jgi:Kef-type K+ transport system membrane component KefB
MSTSDAFVLETLLTLCLLLFAAKICGEVARRFNIASVVGELLAGVVLAPTLVGGLHILVPTLLDGFHIINVQLVTVNDAVWMFAQVGAVLLIFLVGLETRFANFRKSGFVATIVAIGGVIVPFILGYLLTIAWGYPSREALLVGAALTATSIAITVKVLKDIDKSKTSESGILIGAAVIDDVLGLIVLAIVQGVAKSGELDFVGISIVTLISVVFWLALVLVGVFVVARLIDRLCPRTECPRYIDSEGELHGPRSPGKHCTLRCDGAQEASVIAMCFGFAYLALLAGLSPILGAFAAGMSIAETKILPTIQEVTEKINFIMAPMFFVVIGALVDLRGLNANSLVFAVLLITLAMVGKIIGCGLPIYLLNRDLSQAIIVGVGMMSRGEVGLIIAGIGAQSGVFSNEVFSAVVFMVVVTTVVTPIVLSAAYKRLGFSAPMRPASP